MDLIWFILAGSDGSVYVKLRGFLVRAVRVHQVVRYRSCFGGKAGIHYENAEENDENGTDR